MVADMISCMAALDGGGHGESLFERTSSLEVHFSEKQAKANVWKFSDVYFAKF